MEATATPAGVRQRYRPEQISVVDCRDLQMEALTIGSYRRVMDCIAQSIDLEGILLNSEQMEFYEWCVERERALSDGPLKMWGYPVWEAAAE